MTRVAILGCGYVGLALGRRLLDAGHEVVGVRRSDEGLRAVADAGIEAVRADVTDADSLAAVPDADALAYAVSAGGRDAAAARESYVEGLRTAIDAFGGREEPPDRLVYTSSTGVYGDHGGDWVDEETELRPATERQRALVEAEEVARERGAAVGMDATVVRLAGIYGPGRYRLERYLDGPVREGWLNLVHRADAAGILAFVLDGDGPELVVGVDDEPVAKPALAEWLAGECGVPTPATEAAGGDGGDGEEGGDGGDGAERGDDGGDGDGDDGDGGDGRDGAEPGDAGEDGGDGGNEGDGGHDGVGGSGRRARSSKRCSNRLLRSLGYEFAYPTYREGYREAVRGYRRG